MNKLILKLAYKHLLYGNPEKAFKLLLVLNIGIDSSALERELYILSSFLTNRYEECIEMLKLEGDALSADTTQYIDNTDYESIEGICRMRLEMGVTTGSFSDDIF